MIIIFLICVMLYFLNCSWTVCIEHCFHEKRAKWLQAAALQTRCCTPQPPQPPQPPPWTSLPSRRPLLHLKDVDTTNQRLNVQRPSVVNPSLSMQRDGERETSATPTPPPLSSETADADGIRDNFLRKWILQIFGGTQGAVGPALPPSLPPSLPPVYSCKSLACFQTQIEV